MNADVFFDIICVAALSKHLHIQLKPLKLLINDNEFSVDLLLVLILLIIVAGS